MNIYDFFFTREAANRPSPQVYALKFNIFFVENIISIHYIFKTKHNILGNDRKGTLLNLKLTETIQCE